MEFRERQMVENHNILNQGETSLVRVSEFFFFYPRKEEKKKPVFLKGPLPVRSLPKEYQRLASIGNLYGNLTRNLYQG